MTVTIHRELIQGSEEWLAARCGLLTASEMKHIITPTLKVAGNDKSRAHVYEIAAQRLTGHVEASYVGDDMLRGWEDETTARDLYRKHLATETAEVGFITNDRWGFTIGYSPDGLVGADGAIETKSRRQKFQVETIVNGEVPVEHRIQIQTGLLVSEREWIDYVSYSNGMPLAVIRVEPDAVVQEAILAAAAAFEAQVSQMIQAYRDAVRSRHYPATKRVARQEMFV